MAEQSMKAGILLVAFGSRDSQAFEGVESRARQRFPGLDIRWAFMSSSIRRQLAGQGSTIESPLLALARLREDGFTHVAVQPLQVVAGAEYHELGKMVGRFRAGADGFVRVGFGKPLLASRLAAERVVDGVLAALPGRQPGEAVVLMGHGHPDGRGDLTFLGLSTLFERAAPMAFLGTLKGQPSLEDVLRQCQARQAKRAYLVPFMVVAGNHALNDLAGAGANSWKSRLEAIGIDCMPVLVGLGENPAAVAVWMDHLQVAVEQLELPLAAARRGGRQAGEAGDGCAAEADLCCQRDACGGGEDLLVAGLAPRASGAREA